MTRNKSSSSKPPPAEMDIPEWDNMKSQINTIVASLSQAVETHRLKNDIADLFGYDIREAAHHYNFTSIEEMLREMPDVVRILNTNQGPLISAVTTEATAHVVELIKQTASKKKNRAPASIRRFPVAQTLRSRITSRVTPGPRLPPHVRLIPASFSSRPRQPSNSVAQRFSTPGIRPSIFATSSPAHYRVTRPYGNFPPMPRMPRMPYNPSLFAMSAQPPVSHQLNDAISNRSRMPPPALAKSPPAQPCASRPLNVQNTSRMPSAIAALSASTPLIHQPIPRRFTGSAIPNHPGAVFIGDRSLLAPSSVPSLPVTPAKANPKGVKQPDVTSGDITRPVPSQRRFTGAAALLRKMSVTSSHQGDSRLEPAVAKDKTPARVSQNGNTQSQDTESTNRLPIIKTYHYYEDLVCHDLPEEEDPFIDDQEDKENIPLLEHPNSLQDEKAELNATKEDGELTTSSSSADSTVAGSIVADSTVDDVAKEASSAASVHSTKSKKAEQYFYVPPGKREENNEVERYYIKQCLESNGGTLFFKILQYHYYMWKKCRLTLDEIKRILQTDANLLCEALSEQFKVTYHKHRMVVSSEVKRPSHRRDKWNSLYETIVDAPEKKLLINEENLKDCGFEITVDEFIKMVSTNEILKEIFRLSLKGTPFISLVPTKLESFLANNKRLEVK